MAIPDKYNNDMREIGFATLERERIDEFTGLDVSRAAGEFSKPIRRIVELADGEFLFSIGIEGTLVFGDPASGDALVIPSPGMFAISGPIALPMRVMRGNHERLGVLGAWSDHIALTKWQHTAECSLVRGTQVLALPFAALGDEEQYLSAAVSRIQTGEPSQIEPLLIGLVSAGIGLLCTRDYDFKLVNVSDEIRDPLRELMLAVKQNPTKRWTLTEGAKLVGFSQYHLSRAFKLEIGYGFPRFADMCRVEIALDKILNSEKEYDQIAEDVGFGTVQALREACKTFLGSNPSELRNFQKRLRRDHRASN